MSVLNHLAQAAAVILLIELLVVVLIFLGIAGGLAFGLRWVRGKADPAFATANKYLERVPGYAERASDIATSPLVKTIGILNYVQSTAVALRTSVEQRRERSGRPAPFVGNDATMEIAARPVSPPVDETESVEPASLV